MACGIPVVGSNSGAIPEVVGAAGLIVSEVDVASLTEALQMAIFNEERASLIEKGLQRARQELSVHAMSDRLLNFYDRILRT
jgi:glycosyltransferase involved in cell wall biosynthesis